MNCANCQREIPDPPPRQAGIWVEVMDDECGLSKFDKQKRGMYPRIRVGNPAPGSALWTFLGFPPRVIRSNNRAG